ncbi:MAG TPA: DUF4238 domain-containing protein [Caulobacteraceae bacterium]|nr:DUF4238 domain-containing protein [Caulobacteraceae bacterium]
MTSANPPVKHHYIPQFQLAEWGVNDGKLWRFLRPIPGKVVTKLVAPAEIGYEKHLYATPGLPPEKAQQIEQHFMSQLDDQAAEAHQLLLKGKTDQMPQKQRSAWSRFIMSQWFRTPDSLRYFKEAFNSILTVRDEALNARYAEVKKDGYPDSLEDVIAKLGPEFAGQAAMVLFRKMTDDPENGLRLNNMQWSVIDAIDEREFLISDAALQQSKAGIFSPQGYITMPITPRKLFVAANQLSVAKAIDDLPRANLVAGNNGAVVRRASLFVGATDLSQEAFIKANFGEEEHTTLIKGLRDRYRADISIQDGPPA